MWPAGSRPLSAKHRLREYDSCCLRGTGGCQNGGGTSGGAHCVNPSSATCAQKAASGLAHRKKAPTNVQQIAKPAKGRPGQQQQCEGSWSVPGKHSRETGNLLLRAGGIEGTPVTPKGLEAPEASY